MAAKAETKEGTEVAISQPVGGLPVEFMDGLEQFQGMGGENITAEDMSVPFIAIAQALSPEINKNDGAYIKGLEQGDFFSKSSKAEIAKGEQGFYFVPAIYRKDYIKWTPRDKGGGFKGIFEKDILDACKQDDQGAWFYPDGDEIVPTANWFGLRVSIEDPLLVEQCVLSLAKTQFKKSKTIASVLKQVRVNGRNGLYNPPFFYNLFQVTSVPEKNDRGNWMGWKFNLVGNIGQLGSPKTVMQEAIAFHEAVSEGKVEIKLENSDNGSTIDSDRYNPDARAPQRDKPMPADDIPF